MTRLLIQNKPFFTINQFNRLSNMLDNAGQVVFGITVVTPLIGNQINLRFFVLGGITVLFCWIVSIWLAKRGDII